MTLFVVACSSADSKLEEEEEDKVDQMIEEDQRKLDSLKQEMSNQ